MAAGHPLPSQKSLGFQEAVDRADKSRRLYFTGRWPDGGRAAQRDAYDADHVAPYHDLHRTFVTPASLPLPRDRTPEQPALARAMSTPTPLTASAAEPVRSPPSPSALSEPPCRAAASSAGGRGATASGRGATSASRATGLAASLRSCGSRMSAVSLRSRISEAVQREVERSSLEDYRAYLQKNKDRERAKRLAMPLHLRTGPSPVYMGFPPRFLAESADAAARPVKMAVDPKWSTDLKKMNDKAGLRIEYERRLSASVTGGMAPELPHMYPKRHLSNPPTPYFRPGVKP